jgi:hypothetical protein
VAAAVSATLSFAQVRHIRASGSTAGLSDVSWLLLTLTYSSWLVFGVVNRDPYQLATNTLSLTGSLWVLARIKRDRRIPVGRIIAVAGVVLASVLLQVFAGIIGSFVAVFGVTSSIRLWQQRTVRSAPDVTGVAIAPWLISSGAQVIWFAHGVAAGKLVVVAHAPFAVVTNLALIAAVLRRRRDPGSVV